MKDKLRAETTKWEKGKEEWGKVDEHFPGQWRKGRRFLSPYWQGKDDPEAQEQAQNSDPGRAHQPAEVDQKSIQLMPTMCFFFQSAPEIPKKGNFSSAWWTC